MTTLEWTPEAAARFEDWLARRLTEAAIEGADPNEVSQDLRAHVHEELSRPGVTSVDLDTLEAVLARIDGPRSRIRPSAAERPVRSRAPGFRFPRIFLFFGVIWPAITLLAEGIFGMCAAEFFDPLPTWWHIVLVALVPAGLLFAYRVVRDQRTDRAGWAAAATGLVMPITIYYMAAFGALLLAAVFGAVVCFMMPWFLPLPWMTLAPVFAAAAALLGFRRVCLMGRTADGPVEFRHGRSWWIGVAAGALILGAMEGPRWSAFFSLERAASEDPEERAEAIVQLRRRGVHDMIHHACFADGRNLGGSVDLTSWILRRRSWFDGIENGGRLSSDGLTMEKAREIFYRVTGKAFTEVKPRTASRLFRVDRRLGVGRAARTDWVWDGERGGDSVGARLPGLTMTASRLDWHVEAESQLGYGEWTIEFANAHANEQEARAQIKLPPDGCVSRLTLWVNGEPEEAAFAGQAQVKAAYKNVVVVQRRDPVLVTQVGPDLVMMQCFPVPANGGKMKLRVGITAPLDSSGRLWMPEIVERNFSMPSKLPHGVWVQSRQAFESQTKGTVETGGHGEKTWQADLSAESMAGAFFQWKPQADVAVWCEDPLAGADEGKFVLATRRPTAARPIGALSVVIDGSASLRPFAPAIVESLRALRGKATVSAWITTDFEPRRIDLDRLDSELSADWFTGGRDAVPALRAALAEARTASNGGAVVWLRGPQPADLGDTGALDQVLQFALRHVPVHSVQLAAGAHRLAEKIYRHVDLRNTPRLADPASDLPGMLDAILAGSPESAFVFSRQSGVPATGVKVSDQLARYAAFAETLAAFRKSLKVPAEKIAAAARHQVVTPVTGAVVLETKQQFAQNGLEQVDPASTPKVPTIPEPGTALLVLSAATFALRRRRSRPNSSS